MCIFFNLIHKLCIFLLKSLPFYAIIFCVNEGGIELNYNNFQKNLKKAMNDCNINQQKLSKITGIPASTINSYIQGKFYPRKGYMIKLANALKVSPSWLAGYDDLIAEDDNFIKLYSLIDDKNREHIIEIVKRLSNYTENELIAFNNFLDNYENFKNDAKN